MNPNQSENKTKILNKLKYQNYFYSTTTLNHLHKNIEKKIAHERKIKIEI